MKNKIINYNLKTLRVIKPYLQLFQLINISSMMEIILNVVIVFI